MVLELLVAGQLEVQVEVYGLLVAVGLQQEQRALASLADL